MQSLINFSINIKEQFENITGASFQSVYAEKDVTPRLEELYTDYSNLIAQGNDEEIIFEAILDQAVNQKPCFN